MNVLKDCLRQFDEVVDECPRCGGVMRLRTADCPKGTKAWVCNDCEYLEIVKPEVLPPLNADAVCRLTQPKSGIRRR